MDDYLTPTRLELISWFEKQAPTLGELYHGCLKILYTDCRIPGWVRFVSHGIREIRNRLPHEVAGIEKDRRYNFTPQVNKIADLWHEHSFTFDGSPPVTMQNNDEPENESVNISFELYNKISILIGDHKRVSLRNEEKATRWINFMIGSENEIESSDPIIHHWWNTTEYFMNLTHENNSQLIDKAFFQSEFYKRFQTFESILSSLVKSFYKTTEELDAILAETNKRTN
ncbi:hypothetical protein GF406_16895 [candidate division KSB1 bacterium]|nr:hypothetical protein [candidate division KSB1 bacterium]